MGRYFIEYHHQSDDGKVYKKWISSADYRLNVEHLLDLMKEGRKRINLCPAFVLTLCAMFEASMNDWLIMVIFHKHGVHNYQNIVKGLLRVGLSEKIRLCVAIITDNRFQIKEEATTVKTLDDLIQTRNKITHSQGFFFFEDNDFRIKPKKQRAQDHPLHTLTLCKCREYYKAVIKFEKKFFSKIAQGYIEENELIREIGGRS